MKQIIVNPTSNTISPDDADIAFRRDGKIVAFNSKSLIGILARLSGIGEDPCYGFVYHTAPSINPVCKKPTSLETIKECLEHLPKGELFVCDKFSDLD